MLERKKNEMTPEKALKFLGEMLKGISAAGELRIDGHPNQYGLCCGSGCFDGKLIIAIFANNEGGNFAPVVCAYDREYGRFFAEVEGRRMIVGELDDTPVVWAYVFIGGAK